MPQRYDLVVVETNGRIIEVPQSYVDRFPEQYTPVKLNKDGALPADVARKFHDARGDKLPAYASTPDELPSTGGDTAAVDVTPTTATPTGGAATTGGRSAAASTGGSNA